MAPSIDLYEHFGLCPRTLPTSHITGERTVGERRLPSGWHLILNGKQNVDLQAIGIIQHLYDIALTRLWTFEINVAAQSIYGLSEFLRLVPLLEDLILSD